jgi:adenylate cyclase
VTTQAPFKTHRRRPTDWLIVLCAAFAALYFILPWQWLDHLECDTVDFRFRLRGVREQASPVVIVGIDDSSFSIAQLAPAEARREPALERMGGTWPWDRRIFASLVEKLASAGARAVVFDIVFASEGPGDAAFAEALARTPIPVVLARQLSPQTSAEGECSVVAIEPRQSLARAGASVRSGYANIWPDEDSVVRRTQCSLSPGELLGDAAESGAPRVFSLAAAAAVALGKPPALAEGTINFRGPAGTLPLLPIENLFLSDRWAGQLIGNGALFKDKVVVVGPLSEVRFKDYHATPYGRMTGVELQGNLVDSLLGEGLLKQLSASQEDLLIALAVALSAWICLWGSSARRQVTGLALLISGWLAATQTSFVLGSLILPVAAPLGALMATGALGIGVRYTAEQRERRRFRSLLSSYVSEQVAEVIARQPENLSAAMRGDRRPVTVLFSDLRGFTRISEQMPPETLVAQLNEYLHAMVDCVLAEGGTVQKFIGDAVLAVWGDTHTEGEASDASRAVAAALAMETALARLNSGWAARPDRVQLQMGIGLHQGVVTVGNMGHPKRMEFGILGDAVNVASRLEGATKHLGIGLLAGAPVARLAAGRHAFARIGRLQVSGREGALEIFTPLDAADQARASWLASYETALSALAAGDAASATKLLRELASPTQRMRALVDFQLRRAELLAAMAPASWDDLLRLTEK